MIAKKSKGVRAHLLPSETWTLERLRAYCLEQSRKAVVAKWRLGQALLIVRDKQQHGDWEDFLESVHVNIDQWKISKALALHFEREDELEGLSQTAALRKAGFPVRKTRGCKREAPPFQSDLSRAVAELRRSLEDGPRLDKKLRQELEALRRQLDEVLAVAMVAG